MDNRIVFYYLSQLSSNPLMTNHNALPSFLFNGRSDLKDHGKEKQGTPEHPLKMPTIYISPTISQSLYTPGIFVFYINN